MAACLAFLDTPRFMIVVDMGSKTGLNSTCKLIVGLFHFYLYLQHSILLVVFHFLLFVVYSDFSLHLKLDKNHVKVKQNIYLVFKADLVYTKGGIFLC